MLVDQTGTSVSREAPLPRGCTAPADALRRPADLLFSWQGKKYALDCTIITPVRAHAGAIDVSTMDQAAAQKLRENRTLCEAAGWTCVPFVASTYGALHATAREFVSSLIAKTIRLQPTCKDWPVDLKHSDSCSSGQSCLPNLPALATGQALWCQEQHSGSCHYTPPSPSNGP